MLQVAKNVWPFFFQVAFAFLCKVFTLFYNFFCYQTLTVSNMIKCVDEKWVRGLGDPLLLPLNLPLV